MTEDERDEAINLRRQLDEEKDKRVGIIFGALLVIFIIICLLTNTTVDRSGI